MFDTFVHKWFLALYTNGMRQVCLEIPYNFTNRTFNHVRSSQSAIFTDKVDTIPSVPAPSIHTSHLVNYPLNKGHPGECDLLKNASAATSTVLLGTARVVIKD